ncbi:MAG: DUF421 domain-containing protein [Clostridiales bacterium]|jgi:uncharacterized membrane protein YcaP (DUF421 family)|nr:DUF421 domain-containing protein [Clostridiales bacterium]
MFTIIIRVIIILLLVLFVIRMMGKRQIGEMQPIELVITYIIAEVACVPMSDPAIPLFYGIVPILTLFLLHYLISFLSRKSLKFRALIDGHSVMVIDPYGINYKALKQLNMNLNDLLEAARSQGYFDLSEIYYAMFETNGKLCIIPKAEYAPLKPSDVKLKPKQQTPPVSLIIDGKAINLNYFKITKQQLEKIIKAKTNKKIKQIAFAYADGQGFTYIQPKEGKYITANIKELKTSA